MVSTASKVSRVNAATVQNFPAPELTKQHLRSRTEELVKDAHRTQVELMTVAIDSREAIEGWFTALLSRHWNHILQFSPDAPEVQLIWNEQEATRRVSVLHRGGGSGNPTSRTPVSSAALQLEIWCCRYIAYCYPASKYDAVIRRLVRPLGLTALHDVLLARLNIAVAAESEWRRKDVGELADGLVLLLHYQLLAEVTSHIDHSSLHGRDMRRRVAHFNDICAEIITLNKGALVKAASEFLRRAAEVAISLDDLIQTARVATVFALGQYSPLSQHAFSSASKITIETRISREINQARLCRMPDDKADAVRCYCAWRDANPALYETLSFPEQVAAAGLKIKPDDLAQALHDDHASHSVSLDAIGAGTCDDPLNKNTNRYDRVVSDGGADAAAIRERQDVDPVTRTLRSAFNTLPPLQRAVLAAFAPCGATDGGEEAWLESVQRTGLNIVSAAAGRIARGGAAALVGTILVRFN